MMTESYTHLRQFTPQVLEAVDFSGGTGAASLLKAVKILKGLNEKKARKVPDQAPDDFVPPAGAGIRRTRSRPAIRWHTGTSGS